MAAVIDRVRGASPWVQDGALALLLFAMELADAAVTADEHGQADLTTGSIALLVVQAVPLLWRRRAPVLVGSISGVSAALYGIGEHPDVVPLAALVGLYTVAAHSTWPFVVGSGVATGVGLGVSLVASGDSNLADAYRGFLLGGLTWVLGFQQWRRNARLDAERAEDAQRAVAAERARIARELHDVVAHHVSMMVVQSEAGAATTGAPAFDAVAATGRQALVELRRLLGVLRDDAAPGAAVAPQPDLDTLDELVAQVRDAGLRVELAVEGPARPLPAGVGLSAYRIVQEALTNTLRHAGPASARVLVRYAADALELEVTDDGRGAGSTNGGPGGGHGLVGIRERVNLFGGELAAGPRPGGGFGVSVRLPTGA